MPETVWGRVMKPIVVDMTGATPMAPPPSLVDAVIPIGPAHGMKPLVLVGLGMVAWLPVVVIFWMSPIG